MQSRRFLLIGLFLALAGATSIARAQLIYQNIGNSSPFAPYAGYAIGQVGNNNQEVAMRFTAGASLFLDFAELRLWGLSGGAPTIALLGNTSGNTPGAILEVATVFLPPAFASPTPVTRAEFSNALFLTAGTDYWLAVSPSGVGSTAAWDYRDMPTGYYAYDAQADLQAPWVVTQGLQGAMRIFGEAGSAAVPEPATYGVFAGLVLVGAALRRRRRI